MLQNDVVLKYGRTLFKENPYFFLIKIKKEKSWLEID
jgi:hypothetical protein